MSNDQLEKGVSRNRADELVNRIVDADGDLAIRVLEKDRHTFYGFRPGCGWSFGHIQEHGKGCVDTRMYRVRGSLEGTDEGRIAVVPVERTPFPYWWSDIVEVRCPNCPETSLVVNEFEAKRQRNCELCNQEVTPVAVE